MLRHLSHPDKSGALQTALICLLVCFAIMLTVAGGLYFLNQDNQFIPDATVSNPIESKPAAH